MVDINKLRTKKTTPKSIDPIEIFRRLPKPQGINDLYTSQAEVLKDWFDRRTSRDIVLKLHTGGGKTLVGLLMAQSTMNETGEPVLYLAPTVQLVNQTIEKASEIGIKTVPYEPGKPISEDFINAKAIMVGTYKALFNGRSKFGLLGSTSPVSVSAVILDDAHASLSVIRESYTLEIPSQEDAETYKSMCGLFRKAFNDIDKLGTFDDIVAGEEQTVLEVPYWAWREKMDSVREILRKCAGDYGLIWPLLRDNLQFCHALIGRTSFVITPIVPFVNMLPTFSDAPRRIFMSATIADDSEIVRTFDADKDLVGQPLKSRSLAGVSERMILIPSLMPFDFDVRLTIEKIIAWAASKAIGSVVLVASDKAAALWSAVAEVAGGSANVERLVGALQDGTTKGPVVFANRYDGIDLPGDSCRILVMHGMPSGTSPYELFRSSTLYGGTSITRMAAQRIEQGIGRGARGAGDYCVVIMSGSDLSSWLAKETNFRFLTSATKAQLGMGAEISKEVQSVNDLADTVKLSLNRDQGWVEYHAETLAELVEEDVPDILRLSQASTERKAIDLWRDGYPEKAISKIEKFLEKCQGLDPQSRGWMEQLAARISDHWGNQDNAEYFQRLAYGHNRKLLRTISLPPYRALEGPGEQAKSIVRQLKDYHLRRGVLQSFEDSVSRLDRNSSANQFEQSLAELARFIGFRAELDIPLMRSQLSGP